MWIRSIAEKNLVTSLPLVQADKKGEAAVGGILKNCFIALYFVCISLIVAVPVRCEEQPEDHQIFVSGFNAYQQKDFAKSVLKLSELLQKYPDTPLRDVALFWLSRSYYWTGKKVEATRYMAQFNSEYPDSLLQVLGGEIVEKKQDDRMTNLDTK